MHAFGGMYVDLDVECYKSSEPFLQGHDLVFQSEKNEEDVSNAVVASITGHPFWNAVVRKMIVVRDNMLFATHGNFPSGRQLRSIL